MREGVPEKLSQSMAYPNLETPYEESEAKEVPEVMARLLTGSTLLALVFRARGWSREAFSVHNTR